MKKNIKLISVLMILILLSGCVKYNANMSVSNDKSVNLELKYAFKKELIPTEKTSEEITKDNADYIASLKVNEIYTPEIACTDYSIETSPDIINVNELFNIKALSPGIVTGYLYDKDNFAYSFYIEISDEQGNVNQVTNDNEYLEKLSFLKDEGYKIEEFSDKKNNVEYSGVKITKRFNSIDNITSNSLAKYDFVNAFTKEKSFDDTKIFGKKANGNYVANISFDFSKVIDDLKIDTSNINEDLEMTFQITLPNQPISNNATNLSEDGKTLIWKLNPEKIVEVKFEFAFITASQTSNMNFVKYIIGGVGGIVIIILVFVIFKKKKKIKESSENEEQLDNKNQKEKRKSFFTIKSKSSTSIDSEVPMESIPNNSNKTFEDKQIENQTDSSDEPEML